MDLDLPNKTPEPVDKYRSFRQHTFAYNELHHFSNHHQTPHLRHTFKMVLYRR